MQEPVVSIIVPVYNVERFLKQCLDSILAQTYQRLEVLLVDDGSTDNSGQICDTYAEKDTRVRVIHQPNMGLSGARNTGIANATGKWISIVDGDDWLDLDAVEKMVSGAGKEGDCDVFIASFYASYPGKEYPDSFFNQKHIIFTRDNIQLLQMSCLVVTPISRKNAVMNVGVTWARLYRTDFIKKNGLSFKVGLKRMQDATFHLFAYEYVSKVCFTDMPVYHYRIWNGSATKRYQDFEKPAAAINEEIKAYIDRFHPSDQFIRCYYTKLTSLLLDMIHITYAPAANPMVRQDKIKEIRRIMQQDCYQQALKRTDIRMLKTRQRAAYVMLRMDLVGPVLSMYELWCKLGDMKK